MNQYSNRLEKLSLKVCLKSCRDVGLFWIDHVVYLLCFFDLFTFDIVISLFAKFFKRFFCGVFTHGFNSISYLVYLVIFIAIRRLDVKKKIFDLSRILE